MEADAARWEGSGKELKAIGVLGSDVYDKLLILQAVRKRFPNAIFFTTDLDARLLHTSQYEWTRNLVIASHFGLQLHPTLQNDIPSFRDSYQTSAFFSVLHSLGHVTSMGSSHGAPLEQDASMRRTAPESMKSVERSPSISVLMPFRIRRCRIAKMRRTINATQRRTSIPRAPCLNYGTRPDVAEWPTACTIFGITTLCGASSRSFLRACC